MNRIQALFERKPQGVLSLYFCAGYPATETPDEVIRTLAQQGIDMIEIGIPFSDPMADGPVIQHAATQALRHGMSLRRLFDSLATVRPQVEIPLLLMGYLNPIMQYGFEAFCQRCQQCGIDGCIIPDLPFDVYQKEFQPLAAQYGLHVIMLITPETSEERIRQIDAHTDGFIYMVSSAATTGAQRNFGEAQQAYFQRVNAMKLRNPRMIGFGISNRPTLQAAFEHGAGAIIGSKFVSLQAESTSTVEAVQKLKAQLQTE